MHDHMLYPNIKVGNSIIQRPGSLMRGTAHSYNISREPSFDIDTFFYDSNNNITVQYERIVIPHLPAKEVFTASALNPKRKSSSVDQVILADKIDALIQKMDKHTTNASLYEILDNIEMPQETRILVEKYLTANGLYREQVKENDNGR